MESILKKCNTNIYDNYLMNKRTSKLFEYPSYCIKVDSKHKVSDKNRLSLPEISAAIGEKQVMAKE